MRHQKSFPPVFSKWIESGQVEGTFWNPRRQPRTNLAEIWPTYRLSDSFSKKTVSENFDFLFRFRGYSIFS